MTGPKLLDLFCGAGGAGMGYSLAGFDVTGVDINPQPRYPFRFVQGDAIEHLRAHGHAYDAIHASPPCQAYTPLGALHPDKTYPDLVAATRDLLLDLDIPWVIENVMAAPLSKTRSIRLCGGMFGLRTYRHRRFEHSPEYPLTQPPHAPHVARTATKRRRELWDQGWHVSITGDVGTYVGPEAMGIDWMSGNEMCEAIPPAYTEVVGRQFLAHLAEERAA
jgi:DNA (cytosine-5)-methyltransferase 1